MELFALADRIASVRCRVAAVVDRVSLDQYQVNAFAFIFKRLDEMEWECRNSNLRPPAERYAEIGRITEETDPEVLPVEIGGELIAVEQAYIRIKGGEKDRHNP